MSRKKPFKSAADHFMQRLDPTVRSSLSETQLSAIRAAFSEVDLGRRHVIDVRGILPLFFARFYFVFLLGRERRGRQRETGVGHLTSVAWGMVLPILMLCPVVLLVFLLMYLIHLTFGVDLVPNSPPWNLLKFW